MHQTPFNDVHVRLGAKMVDFAGWSMPLSYGGIIEEHKYTREGCSLFDVSHMGRLKVTGDDAESYLQFLCTRNLGNMESGVCRYTQMCKEDGGILDDMIVSRYDAHWGVVCNASNREKILAWMNNHAEGRKVKIEDLTFNTAMVALQGPKTMDMMSELLPIDLSEVKRYRFKAGSYMMVNYTIFRSGYTGEDGYEIVLPKGVVGLVAGRLMNGDGGVIRPAGLGARDTLRLEAGMPLYGHELGEDIDPLSAGQKWCVDLEKDFCGVEPMRKLMEQGLCKTLVGLELEGRRTARQHFKLQKDGKPIGEITSGCLSPTLGKSIAMASIDIQHSEVDTTMEVDFNGKPVAAKVVKLPFYKRT